MSLDTRVSTFVPSAISTRSDSPAPAQSAGHAAGYAAGYAAGTRAAASAGATERARLVADHERREADRDEAMRRAIGALADVVAQWERRTAPVLDDAERSLHSAALALTEAMIGHELQPGPGSARSALTRALSLPDGVNPTRVRLSPADLEHAQRILDSGAVALPAGVALKADARLSPGDAMTDYDGGVLDARLSAALDRARHALLDEEARS
ncbi:FliH/SctL family protein [Demequina sp. NBRC 110054]|uniref:FliH/SctL family protein n=1 Tax=Demequina sp. NBRC 110054 TaxID=1570343 RepID=UPI000A03F1A7|nr:FliH/SctL family protein [Demequina sp. NBRC 110054]